MSNGCRRFSVDSLIYVEIFCHRLVYHFQDNAAEGRGTLAEVEKEHEERYKKLLANVEGGKVFISDDVVLWQCTNCGAIVIGKEAPEVCPVCAHPKAYFQLKAENY